MPCRVLLDSGSQNNFISEAIFPKGDSYQTKGFSFRVGRTTVGIIVEETCRKIWNFLQPIYEYSLNLRKKHGSNL